jgi:hypothetical protein
MSSDDLGELAMRYVISTVRVFVGTGLLAALAGCASSPVRRGQVLEPAVGTSFADFTYVDANGRPRTLGENLGDFTILVFTKCGSDQHSPASKALVDLVRGSQDPGIAKTVGFDIHWSETGCAQGDNCHLISEGANLYSICDAKGIVRELYGADDHNQVFFIGSDKRIVDKGSVAEWDSLTSGTVRLSKGGGGPAATGHPQDKFVFQVEYPRQRGAKASIAGG